MSEFTGAPNTRASLLVRLRDVQDAEAWQTFVKTYALLVYGYCRRKGLQDADAADVTQAVLAEVLRAVRGRFEYQPQRGRFRDWLGTVTHRQLLRFQRNQGWAGAEADGLDEVPAAADAAWTEEFNARVLQVALERVQPHFEASTWRAFERVWLEHQPPLEAAAALGLTIDVVYAAKSRVLKRLREELLLLAEDLPQCVPLD
jgi:RNA polymerase sigma-70 factor (ECF subfamily)